MKELILPLIDDWHIHFRDDPKISEMVMEHLLSSGFIRGIPIGNYKKPIETARDVEQEQKRLFRISSKFKIIPCIMLTQNTTPEIVQDAHSAGARIIKWIPKGLSTNSQNGVGWNEIKEKFSCFKEAEKLGMRAMIHMEDSDHDENNNPITPPLFRECLALPKFNYLALEFIGLPITIEHVSSAQTVGYILHKAPPNVRGTITVHHLFGTINNVYDKHEQIIPDQWCMPIFKSAQDREALRQAAIGGSGKFFYASDRAPHKNKDPQNPPAGIYDGLTDICLSANLFEEYNALDKLPNFVSGFGADHYGLPRNEGRVVLRKETWIPPEEVNGVKIYYGGRKINRKVAEVAH